MSRPSPRDCEHDFRVLYEGEYRTGHRCNKCNRAILGDDGVIRDEYTYEVLGHADPPEEWPELEDGAEYLDELR